MVSDDLVQEYWVDKADEAAVESSDMGNSFNGEPKPFLRSKPLR